MDPETDDDDTAQYNLSNRNLAGLDKHQQGAAHAHDHGDGQGDIVKGKSKVQGAGHKRNSSEYSGDWVQ